MPSVRLGFAIAIGFAISLCTGSAYAADESPYGKIVADIVVKNNRLHPSDNILSRMNTRPGRTFDAATITDDINNLLGTRWFANGGVSVRAAVREDGKVVVTLTVIELNNVVQEVVFKGNHHMREHELETLANIRRGSPLHPQMNELSAQIIQEKYREDGRYYATVTLEEGNKLTDTRVVFRIVEGPVVRVEGVEFLGNVVSQSSWLRNVVEVKGPAIGVVNPLTPSFKPMMLDGDRQKLIAYYKKLGYLDVRIPAPEIRPSADLATVTVIWHIDEGIPYTVRNIRVEGNTIYPSDRLNALVETKPGARYDSSEAAKDIRRIKSLYNNSGFQTQVVAEEVSIPGKPGVADIVYRVSEPPPRLKAPTEGVQPAGYTVNQGPAPFNGREQDRIGRIIIRGNSKTAERVILNELGNLREGQVIRYDEIEIARLRLAGRGVFDPENPPTIDVVDNPGAIDSSFKDLVVTVQETRTGNFGFTVAVNSDLGLTGGINVVERNFDISRWPTSFSDVLERNAFRGAGQTMSIDLRPGTLVQSYSVSWREPYLFDSQYGLGTQAYYFNRSYLEYTEGRVGGRITVDRRLGDFWRVGLSTRLENVEISGVQPYSPVSIQRDSGNHTIVGERLGLTRDTRDSPILPTSGSLFDIGAEQVLGAYTFPIGTVEFTKFFTSEYLQRRDGRGKHVFILRSQLAVEGSNAPVFERFYAGGIQSMRGFSFRGVGPFDPATGLNPGGTFSFLNTMEYQVPILPNEKVFLAAFVDHGTVNSNVSLDNYRVTAGIGLRLLTPLSPAPLAFDFAFPIRHGPGDIRQLFSFSMGGVFGR
ncbi:MAG: POTRA domain-containing protein [Gemmataceae bacterium]